MIVALVSVYHPTDAMVSKIAAIAAQTDRTYICDNSSVSHDRLFAPLIGEGRAVYVWFGENLGLSRGFNRILKNGDDSWNPEDYVLFFDQDSSVAPGHVEELVSCFAQLKHQNYPVGCIGPAYYNTSSGRVEIPRSKKEISHGIYAVSSIITSSMLTTYDVLEQVGFWNERIFLDMADWDLCWRIQKAGMLCCLTEKTVLHHSVGCGEKQIGPLRLRVGAPFREYYQIRDCLHLLFQSYTPLKYRVRFCAMLLIRSPLHVIFLDHRKQRLNYIFRGIRDFFCKKTGPLPEEKPIAITQKTF